MFSVPALNACSHTSGLPRLALASMGSERALDIPHRGSTTLLQSLLVLPVLHLTIQVFTASPTQCPKCRERERVCVCEREPAFTGQPGGSSSWLGGTDVSSSMGTGLARTRSPRGMFAVPGTYPNSTPPPNNLLHHFPLHLLWQRLCTLLLLVMFIRAGAGVCCGRIIT